MPKRLAGCQHCGHENPFHEPYCLACGARVQYVGREETDETEGARQPPAEVPGPRTVPPEPTEKPVRPEEPSGRPVIMDLEGLLPESELPHPFAWQEPVAGGSALNPEAAHGLQNLPRMGFPAGTSLDPVRRTSARFSQTRWPVLFLLAAALLTAIIAPAVGEATPYRYEGSLYAARHLQELDAAARVLVFWQNHPGVAGELDTAATPVLAALLRSAASLSFFSQHPLALPRVQTVLDNVRAPLLRGLPEGALPIGMPTVSTMEYWPGGPAALPALVSNGGPDPAPGETAMQSPAGRERLNASDYDLHLIVTDQAIDVIHWLELVSPETRVPVLAVTSAAAAPLLAPYLETGQLAGIVGGIGDAHHLAEPFAAGAAEDLMRRTLALSRFQGWMSMALAIVILGTLVARGMAPQP